MIGKRGRKKKGGNQGIDQGTDKERNMLIEEGFVEKKEWQFFNGRMRRDEEGEYMFTGGTEEIIHYIIGSEEVRERIREMKIGCRTQTTNQLRQIKGKKME